MATTAGAVDSAETALRRAADGAAGCEGLGARRRLHRVAPLATLEIAGVTAALAAVLADLHARGETAGDFAPDHVILCGDEALAVDGPTAPLEDVERVDRSPAEDVASLGRLVAWMLDPSVPLPPTGAGEHVAV